MERISDTSQNVPRTSKMRSNSNRNKMEECIIKHMVQKT